MNECMYDIIKRNKTNHIKYISFIYQIVHISFNSI